MRAPRSVTIEPIAMPCRSLNAATDLRARVVTGRCPVIRVSSSAAASMSFGFWVASPMPMLTTTRSILGTAMMVV